MHWKVSKMMRTACVVGSSLSLLMGLAVSVSSSAATAAANPTIAILSGYIGALPSSSARVSVTVVSPLGTLASPVPQTLTETVLTSEVISSGNFNIPIAASTLLNQDALAGNGVVNLDVHVDSGGQSTSQLVALNVGTVPAGSLPISAAATTGSVVLPTFRPFSQAPSSATSSSTVIAPALLCSWVLQSSQEISTRATQIHVANIAGASEQYTNSNYQDASISSGLSINGGAFSFNGSVGISNSVGSGGQKNFSTGTLTWAGDHVYYGEYFGVSNCQGQTLVTPTSSAGDVYDYGGTPGANPWGGCRNDPNGYATVGPNGSYWRSQGTGASYSAAASAWGFSVSASYGFNTNVTFRWATTSNASYVCGTGPVGTTGLYDTP